MVYDPEKYREKREKVLGLKKRTLGFGTLVILVSLVIVAGLGVVTVPRAVSFMAARHLDDAIFKLEPAGIWPEAVIQGIADIDGVKTIASDSHDGRLVITYDRRKIELSTITLLFDNHRLDVSLLNHHNLDASQRQIPGKTGAGNASTNNEYLSLQPVSPDRSGGFGKKPYL